jgi:hypothetical protein
LPTLTFALNGGGTATTEAETNATWLPGEPTVNYVRLGSPVTPPKSLFDEVAIWNRVLSAAEIATLYASPVSIGTACQL